MLEYEYSFKVKDIKPFINFCEKDGYKKDKEIFQIRILYTNNNKILARITNNQMEKEQISYLDFKEENESKKILKLSQESQILEINDKNKEFVNSILKIFKFIKSKELKRKRYIYIKNHVKFEIDDYLQPKMKVVAIEGDKNQVDKVYEDIKELYDKYKV